ncbi:hypothetical protein MRX98_06900 [Desulfatitalea sp. M08but]|uniref:Uncharacterized protein n=1 Tax=Desulfatitalea alkaliphila TaxID=2929485 RepID=A0AA41R2A6_9BACT|nr:hypothetical protein [Desulfatitalea alkaliphila]MCJ8500298.1 hypothetical protein [Desulfatitalea alkaliphila]
MRLVVQKPEPGVLSVNDVTFFVHNDINPLRDRQQGMVGPVQRSDGAFFIGKQGNGRQLMLGDKGPVGFGGVATDAENFDFAIFEFRDVSLKLNERGRSVAAVVFRIEGKHCAAMIGEHGAERHFAPVLIRQSELRGFRARLGGWLWRVHRGTAGQKHQCEQRDNNFPFHHFNLQSIRL